ncbi:4-alpha-glucanotransferase [Desulfopila sp. IMCC35006]|uniref:4-alpha-glucanotransferase n=1 Tax=Desulfopila sp. IMCC35006 TaxID=2569542 RepID=UPI0010AD817E|nr:4-alpha-glucanotransferase [Desulfopila sp. IMCC35006]TKB27648.1 4-alpha-glucanotransferase [Desulfopila sp. IMCC35006]
MIDRRASGILAHITSLPSAYGIGDIGVSSYNFIDFLVACDQSYWQFLPTGPIHPPFDYSPYMSSSAFAGSSLLISPELLLTAGLISRKSLADHPDFSPYLTDYHQVEEFKKKLLQEAYNTFRPDNFPGYADFLATNSWLDDYAIFMTAKEMYNNAGWFSWPQEIATRSESKLAQFAEQHTGRINYYRFEQFEFFRQWNLLHSYAREKDLQLFGDLPIYISYDSVDVWAHQEIFTLDRKTLRPTHVSGVPPDYFSKTGQRWGTPLYDWQNNDKQVQDQLMQWWTNRLSHLFTLVDIARIDHFRGFESYWSIPEECTTAVDGQWEKGPGKTFFTQIAENLGPVNIIAEDLGIITPEVEALRDELGFPGMKVLQFAFDGNLDNSFLPHNFTSPQSVVYTGTHDNDTTVGWFLSDRLDDRQRENIRLTANRAPHDQRGIHNDLIYLAQSSISVLCIFPLQDILGFGGDCRMNTPGIAEGNWRWRCSGEFLIPAVADQLRAITRRFNRGNKKRMQQTPQSS